MYSTFLKHFLLFSRILRKYTRKVIDNKSYFPITKIAFLSTEFFEVYLNHVKRDQNLIEKTEILKFIFLAHLKFFHQNFHISCKIIFIYMVRTNNVVLLFHFSVFL